MQAQDTIVAPATGAGEAAIAVVRVSGAQALSLAREFAAGAPPSPRRVWHGDYVTAGRVLLDDALFCFFPSPRSYTGEDVLEISCHGNPLIISRIMDDLIGRGCRFAEPGEFTRRAFLNGRMDLTEAEAVIDVIRARSDRALEAAQRQLRGDLGRRIDGLVDRVLRVCAAVEAYIDFPDEDLPLEDRAARIGELEALIDEVNRLRSGRRRRQLLHEGARVVLLGEPNAGKSSLMNRFSGYDRAIVSPEPGTTRDFLEEGALAGPHRIRIMDTAGLRDDAHGVERAGVLQSRAVAETADLFLIVIDARLPFPTLPPDLLARLNRANAIVVRNKIDLLNGHPSRAGAPELDVSTVDVSALVGTGLDTLNAVIIRLLDELVRGGAHEDGALVNLRHVAALDICFARLTEARVLLMGARALELVAAELRHAVASLGEIVGRIDNEAMLDRLFADFCIGK